jgi:hypothetical protein
MATREGFTSITVSKGLKERLIALKTHPRQSHEEVISQLIDEHERCA